MLILLFVTIPIIFVAVRVFHEKGRRLQKKIAWVKTRENVQ